MYTRTDLELFSVNPYLPLVSFREGHLWLSQEVMDDIESFCGTAPKSSHPREILLFIRDQCEELKKPTISMSIAAVNLAGFCTLKTILHAIEARMFGLEVAGEFQHELLKTQFHCLESCATSFAVH